MMATMDAIADASRGVSLAALGYKDVGLGASCALLASFTCAQPRTAALAQGQAPWASVGLALSAAASASAA
jgi:hypothetical protein